MASDPRDYKLEISSTGGFGGASENGRAERRWRQGGAGRQAVSFSAFQMLLGVYACLSIGRRDELLRPVPQVWNSDSICRGGGGDVIALLCGGVKIRAQ